MKDGLYMSLDGTKYWFLSRKYHRKDGPAVEFQSGNRAWWLNGVLHREDGPAIECVDGSKSWYLNGEEIDLEMGSEDPKVKILQDLMKLQEILES